MNDSPYTITAENILKRFPLVLRNDPDMQAFSRIAAEALAERLPETQLPNLYNNIDSLPEEILDALAYDFKTDWYNYNYDIDAKRELIKSTFYVHRYLGTPAAVNRMMSALYPGSYIEEWFDYGGEPYHFQVVIETSHATWPIDNDELYRSLRMVKRLSAHLDGFVYQCNIGIEIETEAKPFRTHSEWAGRGRAGTFPYRRTRGALGGVDAILETEGTDFSHRAPEAGTIPFRKTRGGLTDDEITVAIEETSFTHTAPEAGTIPFRKTRGGLTDDEIIIGTEGTGTNGTSIISGQAITGTEPYRRTRGGIGEVEAILETEGAEYSGTSIISGQAITGTEPYRKTRGGLTDDEIIIGTEGAGTNGTSMISGQAITGTEPYRRTRGGVASSKVEIRTETVSRTYSTDKAGTKPYQATRSGITDTEVEVQQQGTAFEVSSQTPGTDPRTHTAHIQSIPLPGGLVATIEGKEFQHTARWCGKTRTRKRKR